MNTTNPYNHAERAQLLDIVQGILRRSRKNSPNPLSFEEALRRAVALIRYYEGTVH